GNVIETTLHNDFPAARPGGRPNINNMVRTLDNILIMLNHYNSIAQPAKPSQYSQQSVVVALVQTYRRLVKHVTDTDQTTAHLRSQANSLGFSSGKSAAHPVQCQILKSNINHKF
ncbi:unnamed protein product, partial [marine sediment metagenome]